MTTTSPIARLNDFGQSPWYDDVNRRFVRSGELARMIALDGLRGGTSNPTIFDKAVGGSDVYDDQLADLARAGHDAEEIYWRLAITDMQETCDVLRPVFDSLGGADGFQSIEVDPTLAHDTARTIEQVRWLHDTIGRPNLMVKIPATPAGVPAIEAMIAEGRNVNVTLIFSLQRHDEVIEAYLRGLERFAASGGDLASVNSVASFFVSRVDTETDRRLPEDSPLRGKAAVANAKLAYRLFRERFRGERWEALAARGARLQRPLWASTSTKNPSYPDTLYVDELVGRDTVTTLAPASVDALRDHGDPHPDTVERDVEGAERLIHRDLPAAGVDIDDVTDTLEREGVDAFIGSFHDALATIEKRRRELTGQT